MLYLLVIVGVEKENMGWSRKEEKCKSNFGILKQYFDAPVVLC
jgi:hypothetical protein